MKVKWVTSSIFIYVDAKGSLQTTVLFFSGIDYIFLQLLIILAQNSSSGHLQNWLLYHRFLKSITFFYPFVLFTKTSFVCGWEVKTVKNTFYLNTSL